MKGHAIIILLVIVLSAQASAYEGYGDPRQGFRVDNNALHVQDTIIYRTGWYAAEGDTKWTSFDLQGTRYEGSDWIAGTATYALPDFGAKERYVIVFTCTNRTAAWNDWDCHGSRWQIRQYNDNLRLWDFEDGAGGVLHGAAVIEEAERGSVLSLDGVNDYLDLGTFSVPGDELTLSAWFNIKTIPAEADPRIISKGDTQDYQDWALLISRDGYPEFRYHHGWLVNEGIVHDENVQITPEEWHHIAGVFSGGVGTLYYDGEAVATATIAGGPGENDHPVWIGGQSPDPTNRPFPGMIDDVRVYETALSPAQVAELAEGTYVCAPNSNECGSDGCGGQHPQCTTGTCTQGTCQENPEDEELLSFTMDAIMGTTLMDSAGDHDGTIHGATQGTGLLGQGLRFTDGDYVLVPGLLGEPASMTLAAWVNLEDLGTYGSEVISLGDSALLRVGSSGLIAYYYYGSDWHETSGSATISTGTWMHVAYTLDSEQHLQRLYLNGLPIAETNHEEGIVYALNTDTYIGMHGNGQSHFNFAGTLDDVKVFNHPLTQAEIVALATTTCQNADDCPDTTTSTYCSDRDVYARTTAWSCVNDACEEATSIGIAENCAYTCYNNACCTPNSNECGSDGCGGQHPQCTTGTCTQGTCVESTGLQTLRVSDNGRFLVKEDGTPFFYLGDTAWRMPQLLTREEVDFYMQRRQEQGFTVVMITMQGTSSDGGEDNINAYGHAAYLNDDFTQPRVVAGDRNDYWDHLDYIIGKAEEHGLYVAIIPIWSNTVSATEQEYRSVGAFLGNRYSGKNIIWLMGGDVRAAGKEHLFRAMAEEITEAITGSTTDTNEEVLISFHPPGWYESAGYPHSSSYYLHDEHWLDMNGIQSGHYDMDVAPNLNYRYVEHDYALSPAKPTSEMESFYEGHHHKNNPDNRRGDDYDVRRNAYWSVFAGGYGYTYGNNNIWPFYEETPVGYDTYPDTHWQMAMNHPGAEDMVFLKDLMLSRPYLSRVPDESLITSSNPDDMHHEYATRGDGYAFIYIPRSGKSVTIDTGRLSGTSIRSWWYNPRDGSVTDLGSAARTGSRTYTTPTSSGPDWVLVIDDASKGYTRPG